MTDDKIELIRQRIRDVADFPKPGILFKDITPVLADPVAFNGCLDLLAERYQGVEIDCMVGIEARGFIFGAALAARMHTAFVPCRKPGKLPAETYQVEISHRDPDSDVRRVLFLERVVVGSRRPIMGNERGLRRLDTDGHRLVLPNSSCIITS